ncbi:hypothetical protein GLW03_13300 [Halobacillus halophilus]|uniref:coiled-coil domain-containing protein 22 n=1 Tax=Halobacillus halophilus TaxID=1570 RepID=UPI001369D10C|nr:coiled-coil domain-containing protein 22 [Halobacillus halophilus]MYL30787.1 hypothetical protein [Halobacillus halophilus]
MNQLFQRINKLLDNEEKNTLTKEHKKIIDNTLALLHVPANTLYRSGDKGLDTKSIEGTIQAICTISSIHQDYYYARQVVALRVLDTLDNLVFMLEHKRVKGAAMCFRLILETIGLLDKINRDHIQKPLSDIKTFQKEIINFTDRYEMIAKQLYLISEHTLKITYTSKVDWELYIEEGILQNYAPPENQYDPTLTHKLKYKSAVDKLEPNIKPSNGKDWGVVYSFLSDFTHPSSGTHLSLADNSKSVISAMGGIHFRRLAFKFDEENEILNKVYRDILQFIPSILLVYNEVEKRSNKIEKSIYKYSNYLVRDLLKDMNEVNPNGRAILDYHWRHEKNCICLGGKPFKNCCGTLKADKVVK